MSKTYYFPDAGINPDTIYGSDYPVCLSKDTVEWLSHEWETDLMQQMHEATPEEIAEYGTEDDEN